MGLISRVSSRTYSFRKSTTMFRCRALTAALVRQQAIRSQSTAVAKVGHNSHALKPEVIQGDYQVWVGYLRRPPPNQTGWDIPTWAVFGVWGATALLCYIFGTAYVFKVRQMRRELFKEKVLP